VPCWRSIAHRFAHVGPKPACHSQIAWITGLPGPPPATLWVPSGPGHPVASESRSRASCICRLCWWGSCLHGARGSGIVVPPRLCWLLGVPFCLCRCSRSFGCLRLRPSCWARRLRGRACRCRRFPSARRWMRRWPWWAMRRCRRCRRPIGGWCVCARRMGAFGGSSAIRRRCARRTAGRWRSERRLRARQVDALGL
jgi:hypothetical protein